MRKIILSALLIVIVTFILIINTVSSTEKEQNNVKINNYNLITFGEYQETKNFNNAMLIKVKKEENNITKAEMPSIESTDRPQYKQIKLSDKLLDYIWNRCKEENISYELMLALANAESSFNPVEISSVNNNGTIDKGLFQINSRNTEWLSELAGIENADSLNPYDNFEMSLAYINYLRDRLSNYNLSEEKMFDTVIICYNKGYKGGTEYIKKYGYNYSYLNKILKTKTDLEKEG